MGCAKKASSNVTKIKPKGPQAHVALNERAEL